MKTFLAWWLVVQLLIVGGTVGMVHEEVGAGTYNCREGSHYGDRILGMLFPLVVFVPTDKFVERYCEGKR